MHCVFNSHEILPPGLETHRDKAETITSEILDDFLHGCYDIAYDHKSYAKSSDYTLNPVTHFLPGIYEDASELRNSEN